jgi:C4-dicarboxylate-specific signal transduction histidine kinase
VSRGLFRLIVPLAAMVLIGLAAVDVVFVLWSQRRASTAQELGLRLAAQTAAQAVGVATGPAEAQLVALAAEHQVELTLLGPNGETLSTLAVAPRLAELAVRPYQIGDGYAHAGVPLGAGSPWAFVVASRRLEVATAAVLAEQGRVLAFLAVVALGMVLLGVLFLRRAVLQPVARMTELVGDNNRSGLLRFGSEVGDDFAHLSSAIITMTQRIEDDRQRIAGQLDSLAAAHQELTSAQAQLVRAERLAVVGQLAAGLAHEIGNPLAVLTGYLDVLKLPDLAEGEREEAIAHMARELDRMHRTMRDLLDFSRAPATASGAGDVGEAMVHVQKLLAPQERLRAVALRVDAPAAPLAVGVDTQALTQVLLNLVLNAVDAVGKQGEIRITARREGAEVAIVVEDSGPGVPAELCRRIFEPFFTTKPAKSGTGLGLAVCDHIVTSARGAIRVDRGELGGARFTVTLPTAGSPGGAST